MAEYPPYVNGYGGIPKLFSEIRRASVPPKFTQDFMSNVLGLKSSSYRAMIPLLKRLGFIDANQVPTQAYKDYRGGEHRAKQIMAQQIRQGYEDVYRANEYAHKLSKPELLAKLKIVTGAGDDDKNLQAVAGTFVELCKLADFQSDASEPFDDVAEEEVEKEKVHTPEFEFPTSQRLGISYTINLNLPATTDIEVFNAIFKSLREHILGGEK